MRRLEAILVLVALLAAPLALSAGIFGLASDDTACTMSCCLGGKCLAQHRPPCPGSQLSVQCDCSAAPVIWLLAPLPRTVLPRPVPRPFLRAARAFGPDSQPGNLSGFLPDLFQPPRV